ncbi:MAG: hypothetical protein KDA24_18895 [Deltaproteobacteria bacterium]|nr:hypothetical protein [Deltaproteobacteria bacterium]
MVRPLPLSVATLVVLALVPACAPGDPGDGDPTPPAEEGPAWGDGARSIRGNAFFFDMQTVPQIDNITDVEGALLYVFEAPEIQAVLDPADGHAFELTGIPEGKRVTLALTHPDFFPHLTGTFTVGDDDLEDMSFQSVSNRIAELASELLQVDIFAPGRCQMATTVTALGAVDIYAPGEPGANVTLDPPVPNEQGPYYFNEMVLPTVSLTETTTDGGVTVVDAEPGEYVWSGNKEGMEIQEVTMKCVAGWLTNAAPPWGMNVLP